MWNYSEWSVMIKDSLESLNPGFRQTDPQLREAQD